MNICFENCGSCTRFRPTLKPFFQLKHFTAFSRVFLSILTCHSAMTNLTQKVYDDSLSAFIQRAGSSRKLKIMQLIRLSSSARIIRFYHSTNLSTLLNSLVNLLGYNEAGEIVHPPFFAEFAHLCIHLCQIVYHKAYQERRKIKKYWAIK